MFRSRNIAGYLFIRENSLKKKPFPALWFFEFHSTFNPQQRFLFNSSLS